MTGESVLDCATDTTVVLPSVELTSCCRVAATVPCSTGAEADPTRKTVGVDSGIEGDLLKYI